MSSNGVGVLVPVGTTLDAGHHLRLILELGKNRLEIEARIAHLKSLETGLNVGLRLVFSEFELQKSYLQLLQPVVIGQTLQPLPVGRVLQDEPRFSKQVYTGDPDALLTVRREQSEGAPLHSFEFQMPDSFCRGYMPEGTPRTYALESMEMQGGGLDDPVFETSGGLHEEVRQLFRWILPNLSPAVPEDVRAFLQRFAG
jgi:hypothetical protein